MNAVLPHDPTSAFLAGIAAAPALLLAGSVIHWLYRKIRPGKAGCAGCGYHDGIDTTVHVPTEGYADPWHAECLSLATGRLPHPVTGTVRDVERLAPDAPELPGPQVSARIGGAR